MSLGWDEWAACDEEGEGVLWDPYPLPATVHTVPWLHSLRLLSALFCQALSWGH